uniref:Uncharacterized protein n=1 Tax=Anguilla anguilla TaxID=7936 RepID=A0A0E9SAQ4_ANGAN
MFLATMSWYLLEFKIPFIADITSKTNELCEAEICRLEPYRQCQHIFPTKP